MLPANSSSTTWSASRWSVQLTCPSGGLLHAMATRCASCLPLNLRSRPGRGRSLMAASSPSSTNRLRALATVRALTETASAASRPDSPSSAFSNARAPLYRAGQRLAPAGYLNQIGPLGWCQFDFVLYGRHIRVRPPWKIIPKPTQSHILYQHFMEPVLVVSHVWNRRDRGDVIWFGHPGS